MVEKPLLKDLKEIREYLQQAIYDYDDLGYSGSDREITKHYADDKSREGEQLLLLLDFIIRYFG